MALTQAERVAKYRAARKLDGRPDRSHGTKKNRSHGTKKVSGPKQWLFIDTEGASLPDGDHRTFLICAAADGCEDHLISGEPLITEQMLAFILRLPSGFKLGGYFFQYDIDQILHDVDEPTLRTLYGVGEPARPVAWRQFLLARFNTQLTVAWHRPGDEVPEDAQRVKGKRIWDVGKFYQCSFLKAVENWGVATAQEAELIARMKASRRSFTPADFAPGLRRVPMLQYSLLENRLAARLQTRFDALSVEHGYPLTAWYGAGSMAKAMMLAEGVKAHLVARKRFRPYKPPRGRAPDRRLERQLPFAYFGGRFEIAAPGRYGPIYEYDLRSAYPASYRSLPCVQHSDWMFHGANDIPSRHVDPQSLYLVTWEIPRIHRFGPFPVRRSDGTIHYPRRGALHRVWGEELAAALRIWPSHIHFTTGWWEHRCRCDCRPFEWIDRVYALRRELGKDVKGYPLKLGMNACYGSLASVLGSELEDGAISGWFEPRWASMITAWCRARLLDALHQAGPLHKSPVIMFATDAVYSTEPIGLDCADRLGGWEAHEFPSGLLIQPGVYHLEGQALQSKLKGRGILFRDLQDQIERFYAEWDAHHSLGTVDLHLTDRYHGIRLQLHRGKLQGAWRWESEERTLHFEPSTKRQWRRHQWLPIDGEPAPCAAHKPMMELLSGVALGPDPVPAEQLEQVALEEAQPDGPMAL